MPDAPADTALVRAIELNTLVDGEVTATHYDEPVRLVFVLTEAEVALAEGDTSRLGVLLFNEETGEWELIAVSDETQPPSAGRLVALLDHFSLYVMVVTEEAAPEPQQVSETATPVPTAAPTVTSLPMAVPTPTSGAVATSTQVPATPTATAVTQAVAPPMPLPTVEPEPTATIAPPLPAVPAAPAPLGQPPAEADAPPVLEEPGGIGDVDCCDTGHRWNCYLDGHSWSCTGPAREEARDPGGQCPSNDLI